MKKIKNLLDFLLLAAKASSLTTGLLIVLTLLRGGLPSLLIISFSRLLAGKSHQDFLEATSLVVSVLVLSLLVKSLHHYILKKHQHMLEAYLDHEIIRLQGELTYHQVEDPLVQDFIHRLKSNPTSSIGQGLETGLNMVHLVMRVVGFVWILTTHIWWLGLVVIWISIPLFYLSRRLGQLNYQAFEAAEVYERQADYYKEILSSRDYVYERTLLGYKDMFMAKWQEATGQAIKINMQAMKTIIVRLGLAQGVSKCLGLVIGLCLLIGLYYGYMTPADFMTLFSTCIILVDEIADKMTWLVKGFIKNLAYFKDFKQLQSKSMPREVVAVGGQEVIESIEFRSVSFKYPSSQNYVLKDLNFKLVKGKSYALVGENGSGKTTMVKLLLGLYHDYEGEILINGRCLKSFSQADLSQMFQVAFQDFYPYPLSIYDYLCMGHKKEKKAIVDVLDQVGLDEKINQLDRGLMTSLGKIDTDNTDLSGGQWQRLLLARCILHERPVMVLDEPTAAIDPVEERALFKLMSCLDRRGIQLMVTHRMGACQLVDQVLVLGDGSLKEVGSPNDLIQKNGLYANLYETQRSWYDDSKRMA